MKIWISGSPLIYSKPNRLCGDLNRLIHSRILVTQVVWKMSLLEGPRKVYFEDFPTKVRGQNSRKFCVTSVQGVDVKEEDFVENEETEYWPFRELVGSLMIFLMQFDQFRDSLPLRKLFTAMQRYAFSRTLMVRLGLVLQIKERR